VNIHEDPPTIVIQEIIGITGITGITGTVEIVEIVEIVDHTAAAVAVVDAPFSRKRCVVSVLRD